MPSKYGSTSAMTALVAMAASTALPPRSSTCTPARAASGWLAATMPYFVAIFDRPTSGTRRGRTEFSWPTTPLTSSATRTSVTTGG